MTFLDCLTDNTQPSTINNLSLFIHRLPKQLQSLLNTGTPRRTSPRGCSPVTLILKLCHSLALQCCRVVVLLMGGL